MLETTFGLLTPEETLARATRLNNNFQLLWRNANSAQKKVLDPTMAGWVQYFDRLRTSWTARATEYGELTDWEKRYQQHHDTFSRQGTTITAPVVVPGLTPGGEVRISTPDIGKGSEDIKKASENLGTFALIGVVGVLGLGALFLMMKQAPWQKTT